MANTRWIRRLVLRGMVLYIVDADARECTLLLLVLGWDYLHI